MITIRPVGECPAPPKSQTHEFAVDPGVDEMAGRGYLGTRGPTREVAAWVRRGRIKLQRRGRRQVVESRQTITLSAGISDQGSRDALALASPRKRSTNCNRCIGRAPNDAKCAVSCWQSIIGNPLARNIATR
jgi:hypothetical protein